MAAEECSRLPNIPAISGAQTLVEAIDQLRNQMTEQFNTLKTAVNTLETAVATLQTDITARFNANDINATARLYNSTINNAQTPFQPLQDRHNMPVHNFPVNGEALSHLNRLELQTILRAYNLSTDGDIHERRKRLASYIGIVVQVF
ncbi:MAG: hypothetical protein M1836_002712 [Candelina mexicana]|nr:MAG: hypothetical protein M1836_002712 [Candelina mexicana]